MINHVRTLLRNTSPEPYAGGVGEEIVDPSFVPVVLPAWLAAIRTILFGRNPDRASLDLSLRRYMALLHSTPLVAFVLDRDTRVTYPAPVVDLLEFDFQPRIIPVGSHDAVLYLTGDTPKVSGGGAIDYRWIITAYATIVRIERLQPDATTDTQTVDYTDGLGSLISLRGSALQVRFDEGLAEGTGWLVSCLARPTLDLGETLAAIETVGDAALSQLFGPALIEPYRTWKQLWESTLPLPYRLGAILLALAARTDAQRKA